MSSNVEYIFDVATPLGFLVRSTEVYWKIITTIKHPVMADKLDAVKNTLSDPDEIRQSKSDPQVLLFYRTIRRACWLCAVVKRLNGMGFLVTAYPTENIKEGKQIWKK